jgi:hypothetical protein
VALRNGQFPPARRVDEGGVMFSVIHADGSGGDDPPLDSLSELYDELLSADDEHPDVAVVHQDTGWSISAYKSGRLDFEHLGETSGERHMIPVSKKRVIELWIKLIEDDIDAISAEPWKPRYN